MGILSFFQIRRDRREAIDVEKWARTAQRLGKPIWETLWTDELARCGGLGAIRKGLSSTDDSHRIRGGIPT
jgi:hypothetical protein